VNAWEGFSADFDDKTPIYSQIIALFSRSFVRGEIGAGERIPSIREMALKLRVNANTMQRVYQEMERDRLIVSKRGTGYFFTEDMGMIEQVSNSMASGAIAKFLEEMRGLGYSDNQIITELKNRMIKTEGGENLGADTGNGH
jgi:DNA-binding transcriptional regulator YhcF (GntR family)